jgi:hypothetical protein
LVESPVAYVFMLHLEARFYTKFNLKFLQDGLWMVLTI